MRYDGQYINVKSAWAGPGRPDPHRVPRRLLQFLEMYSFAKPRHVSKVAALMPKPVTLYDPVVHLYADMSDPKISELQIPRHFTNIQHGLYMAASSCRCRTRRTGRSP